MKRFRRDVVIVVFGLALAAYGALTRYDAALIAGVSIVLSPTVLRSDERNGKD